MSDGAFAGPRRRPPTPRRSSTRRTASSTRWSWPGEKKKTKINAAVTVKVDNRVEWQQIFDECWRVMKYRFYDEKMHGRDWNAIKADLRAAAQVRRRERGRLRHRQRDDRRAERVAHRRERARQPRDARRLHDAPAGLRARGRRRRVPDQPHVYRKGPADKEWLDLKVGDYVLAIDGTADQGGRQLLGAAERRR